MSFCSVNFLSVTLEKGVQKLMGHFCFIVYAVALGATPNISGYFSQVLFTVLFTEGKVLGVISLACNCQFVMVFRIHLVSVPVPCCIRVGIIYMM